MSETYVTLKIPKELANTIDEIIKSRKAFGYKSRAEFVKEAIRTKLIELEKVKS